MTEQAKQLLKRINGRAGWAAAAIAGGALAYNVFATTWGAASASGAQGQRIKQVVNDVKTLEGQYEAIRQDLSEIKVRIERVATKLESDGQDGQ